MGQQEWKGIQGCVAEVLGKDCYDFTAKEGEVRQKSVWEMMDPFTSIGSKSGLIGGKIRDSVFRIIVSYLLCVFYVSEHNSECFT